MVQCLPTHHRVRPLFCEEAVENRRPSVPIGHEWKLGVNSDHRQEIIQPFCAGTAFCAGAAFWYDCTPTTTELTSCQNSSWYEGIVLVNLGTVQRQLARTTVLCMPGSGPKMTSAPSTIIISSNQIHYIVLTDHKTRITWPKITISHYQQLWGIQPSPQAATTATACRLAEPSLRYYERSNKPERSPSVLVVILANYS